MDGQMPGGGMPPGPGMPGGGMPPGPGMPGGGMPPGPGMPGGGMPPGPQGPVTDEEKLWGLLSHLSFFVLAIIGPIIIMYVKKDSRFLAHHAKQALIWQIIAIVGGAITCGILTIVCMVFAIIAGLKAYNGEMYTYPMLSKVTAK